MTLRVGEDLIIRIEGDHLIVEKKGKSQGRITMRTKTKGRICAFIVGSCFLILAVWGKWGSESFTDQSSLAFRIAVFAFNDYTLYLRICGIILGVLAIGMAVWPPKAKTGQQQPKSLN
jgi:hypothetical protein